MYFLLNYVGNNFSAIKTFRCMLIKYFRAPSVLLDEWCQFNFVILANLSANKKLWKFWSVIKKTRQWSIWGGHAFLNWDTCALCRQHWSFPLWCPLLKPLLWIAHWPKWPRWFIAGRWQLITPSDELMVTWLTLLWCPVKGNHATHRPLHEND